MRVLDGDQFLVRIFLGESDKWRHTPLARAILERLRAEGFAGATVMLGVGGFGASSVIHTASLIGLSTDLPVVIEVVDVTAVPAAVTDVGVSGRCSWDDVGHSWVSSLTRSLVF